MMVVLTHFGCIALRVVDFFVGVVLFITISRPLLSTFVCGGNGASADQEAQCWTMTHLTNCAIAAPAVYVYVMMSWRIQRAYGNCGLFASRSLVDLFQFNRDNVHDSRVHHLINFPCYCNASMYASNRQCSAKAQLLMHAFQLCITCSFVDSILRVVARAMLMTGTCGCCVSWRLSCATRRP